MRVQVVDPSAFTPPYDHALCAALARAGATVELVTGRFGYGAVPVPDGYVRRDFFYRRVPGQAGSLLRRLAKAAVHGPEMVAYRRVAASADVMHFQWLDVQWLDRWLLPPGPVVLTAHDLLPREARWGQAAAQRRLYEAVDAIVVHSQYGREQLVDRLGVAPDRVHVIHHGAFDYLVPLAGSTPLPAPLAPGDRPVVLFFGLLRPYKGVETLLAAWSGIDDAELWIVGRPRMAIEPLEAQAPPGVTFVPRYVADRELAACFERADVVVLPYTRTERFDQSGVMATALAFGKPIVASRIGGFGEVAEVGAARLVPPADAEALHRALSALVGDPDERARLATAARAAAAGPYSWDAAAERTLALYRELIARRGR